MDLENFVYPHILGGLYGQAWGDAWAMAALFRPRQTWDHYGGWVDYFAEPPADHPIHGGLKAGQVTDDTQQAMALARVIIAKKGRLTVKSVVRAVLDWYDEIGGDTSSFVGPSTRKAVLALKAGQDPALTGLRGDTNGSAMRVSPVGLIHPGDPEAAVEDAIISCIPTHFTDVAVSGTCAVAAAIAEALTPNTTLETIIDTATWAADLGLKHGQPWLGASVSRKIDYAVHLATDLSLPEFERIQNLYDLIGSTLAVADSVPCAFGILAMANGDPVQAAIYATALSGDADTVGAIACAIAGAWHGIQAIPQEHIDALRQANPQYDFEETADSLFSVALHHLESAPPPAPVDLKSILGDD